MSDKSTKADLKTYLSLQKTAQSLATIQIALPALVNERTLRRWLNCFGKAYKRALRGDRTC